MTKERPKSQTVNLKAKDLKKANMATASER